MGDPRPEKVAVVDEVRERFRSAQAVLLTEYRGLTVAELAQLRASLRDAGGEYGVYKNTLVRLATRDLGLELDEVLTGPTALAFVPASTEEGAPAADPVLVAKALDGFAKGNEKLVLKGGVLGTSILSADDTRALAKVAPREELLARFAGLLAAPMQQLAGLLEALPRNFAYGLAALIDQGGAGEAPVAAADADPDTTSEEAAPAAEPADDPAAPAADPQES